MTTTGYILAVVAIQISTYYVEHSDKDLEMQYTYSSSSMSRNSELYLILFYTTRWYNLMALPPYRCPSNYHIFT